MTTNKITNSSRNFDEESLKISYFPHDQFLTITILVTTLATIILALIAAAGQITLIAGCIAALTGTIDLASIIVVGWKKCCSTPRDMNHFTHWEDQSHIEPSIQSSLSPQEWDAKLSKTPVRSPSQQYKLYNLLDPTQPLVPDTQKGYAALPAIGNYQTTGYQKLIFSPRLGARLPLSQFQAAHESVKKIVRLTARLELYFFIYYDTEDKTTQRNLVLHFMAMPEYQKGWMERKVQAIILEPEGVRFNHHDNDLSSKKLKEFRLIFHPTQQDDTAISPDNCKFHIDPSAALCRFYIVTRIKNRHIVCYTLLVRKNNPLLDEAISKSSLAESLEILYSPQFPYSQEIQNLFQHYS